MANTISISRRGITIVPDGSTDFDIATMQPAGFPLKTLVIGTTWFSVGETVTQATSNATGVVVGYDIAGGNIWLDQMTGTFDTTHVVTGGTSGAHGIPTVITPPYPNGVRLSAVRLKGSAGDLLVVRENTATGPVVFSFVDKDGKGEKQSVGGRSLRMSPFIKMSSSGAGSDCSFAAAASTTIFLEFD